MSSSAKILFGILALTLRLVLVQADSPTTSATAYSITSTTSPLEPWESRQAIQSARAAAAHAESVRIVLLATLLPILPIPLVVGAVCIYLRVRKRRAKEVQRMRDEEALREQSKTTTLSAISKPPRTHQKNGNRTLNIPSIWPPTASRQRPKETAIKTSCQEESSRRDDPSTSYSCGNRIVVNQGPQSTMVINFGEQQDRPPSYTVSGSR